jgi:glycosyltransferase involved in cell wall biosynthesis
VKDVSGGKMRVWILQTGEPIQIDNNGLRPIRAINLSKALIDQGHHVTLWSSDFDHFTKLHRFGSEKTIEFSNQLTIRLIKSRGYKSHIGLSRFFDHAQLGWNLNRMLKKESAPDVALIGYPPIEPAWVMARWLRKQGSPSILDVKDAWPDSMIGAFPTPLKPLAKIAFFPYFVMLKQTLKAANGISSISQEFLDWCLSRANRIQNESDFVFSLSTQDKSFSKDEIEAASYWWESLGIKSSNNLIGYFVGSMTDVFDFQPIINAARKLPIFFVLAGDGPRLESLRNETINIPNIVFPGRISSVQAKILSSNSDFSLAPLVARPDFEMSIPNKFYDALQMGKPMITSLSGPARRMLEESMSGLYYKDEGDFENILNAFALDTSALVRMSNNALLHFNSHFSFNQVYGGAVQKLEQLREIK